MLRRLVRACLAIVGLAVFAAGPANAKVEDDTIYLGAAISLTGKYAANGEHTQRGYDLAVKMINDAGGVTVDGKQYQLASSTTMTSRHRPAAPSLPSA